MEPTTSTSKTSTKAAAPVEASLIKKNRAPKKAAPAKTPKREKLPAEDVCVFAFRLSTQERARIHEAAGSGKASQFVLSAALAAAQGDAEAFKAVVASRASK